MSKKRDIDPTVERALGESAAHNAEASRLISEFAKSRGCPIPNAPQPLPDNWQEELTPIQNDVEDLKRQMAKRGALASNPEFSLRAPGGGGFRVAGLAGWQITSVLICLAAIAAWAWVATHAVTASPPVPPPQASVPAHS